MDILLSTAVRKKDNLTILYERVNLYCAGVNSTTKWWWNLKFHLGISYKDNPLLFILCVADTIEPSKKFPNYRNEDVLNLISIEYSLNDNFCM